MDRAKNLMELNDYILMKIMSYLNASSLIAITETCTTFNNLVIETDRFMKKIYLNAKFPKDEKGQLCMKRDIGYMENIMKSQRKYRNMRISFVTKECIRNNIFKSQLFSFISKFGLDVQVLILCDCHFLDKNEFENFINCFKNVITCELNFVHIFGYESPHEQVVAYPNLEELRVACSSYFCREIFYASENLKMIQVEFANWENSVYVGTDKVENFLLKQKNLKKLILCHSNCAPYGNADVLKDVPFQLEFLRLEKVFFANKNYAYNFFKTQKSLETVSLELCNPKSRQLDVDQFYEDILLHVFNNRQLRKVEILLGNYKFVTLDFLNGLTNKSVVHLEFRERTDATNFKIVEILAKAFPNVKSFLYNGRKCDEVFEAIRSFKHLERLIIGEVNDTSPSYLDRVDVISGKLTTFSCGSWKKDEDMIEDFMIRNPTITRLILPFLLSKVFAEKILTSLPLLEHLVTNGVEDGVRISRFKEFTHFKTLGFNGGMLETFYMDDEE